MKTITYNDLEIYRIALELAIKVHKITLTELPKFELFEEGSQIRRSSKSIVSNIVEGFGRRKYKGEFVQFLTYALSSSNETKSHLDMLYKTGSLTIDSYQALANEYDKLCGKIYSFREAVIKKHRMS